MLPKKERELAELSLARYCANKVPVRVQNKLRIGFAMRGKSATLFEERPVFNNPTRWTHGNVAQFRFDATRNRWLLYYRDRNSRWHLYERTTTARSIQTLLEEVEKDPTGIFWG